MSVTDKLKTAIVGVIGLAMVVVAIAVLINWLKRRKDDRPAAAAWWHVLAGLMFALVLVLTALEALLHHGYKMPAMVLVGAGTLSVWGILELRKGVRLSSETKTFRETDPTDQSTDETPGDTGE